MEGSKGRKEAKKVAKEANGRKKRKEGSQEGSK